MNKALDQKDNLLKLIIIGLEDVGKTSIAKFYYTINLNLSLNTTPSTYVEKYSQDYVKNKINIFVLPGQRNYMRSNLEYLYNIIDKNSVIFYVIDANDLKKQHETFKNIITYLSAILHIKKIKNLKEKIPIAFLAHKQDLPNAMKAENYIKPIEALLEKYKHDLEYFMFDTSLFLPQTLLNVFKEMISPRIFHLENRLANIAASLLKYTHAVAVAFSDHNGFPLAIAGSKNLALWISILPVKINGTLDEEWKILRHYNDHLLQNISLQYPLENLMTIHKINLGSLQLFLYSYKNSDNINIAIANPKISHELLETILPEIANRLLGLLKKHGDYQWR